MCIVSGDTCVCDTSVTTQPVFTDYLTVPTRAEVLTQLHIGSPPPEVFDNGLYSMCTTAPCFSASEVDVFTVAGGAFDESTIFRVEVHGTAVYLANRKSTVTIGTALTTATTYEFRNPPSIMNPLLPTVRDAEQETEALLDHLFHHQNTAPFLARQLIQRFVVSNPSPRYVAAVATAFSKGEHGGVVYSGRYGDIGAAVAAVLLDPAAREVVLDLDPTHGQYREPLLKARAHLRVQQPHSLCEA